MGCLFNWLGSIGRPDLTILFASPSSSCYSSSAAAPIYGFSYSNTFLFIPHSVSTVTPTLIPIIRHPFPPTPLTLHTDPQFRLSFLSPNPTEPSIFSTTPPLLSFLFFFFFLIFPIRCFGRALLICILHNSNLFWYLLFRKAPTRRRFVFRFWTPFSSFPPQLSAFVSSPIFLDFRIFLSFSAAAFAAKPAPPFSECQPPHSKEYQNSQEVSSVYFFPLLTYLLFQVASVSAACPRQTSFLLFNF